MHSKRPTRILVTASLAVVLLAIFTTQLGGSPELASISISTGAPQRLDGTLPPGGVYRFTPAPIAGTPEPNPTLTLQIAILDARTGQPIQADVLVNDVPARSGVDRAEFRLPGRTDGITVTVRADGYVPWSQGLRYKLDHSRVLYLRAELTPLALQSGALPTLADLPFSPTFTPTGTQAVIALASPLPALLTDTPAPAAELAPPVSPMLPTPLLPTSSPTLTPSPTAPTSPVFPTPTPSDPAAWWSWPCNVRRPHYPDGCPEFARWDSPPDHPITAPCIRTAYTEAAQGDCEGEVGLRVVIILDHPEAPRYTYPDFFATQEVHVTRCGSEPALSDALSADTRCPSSKGEVEGGQWWTDVGPNWGYDCNLNPAPLAWAVTEALNARSLAPFDVAYDVPLPTLFVDFVVDLIEAEEPTPMPTATLTPRPTVDSPLPTPPP